MSHEVAPSPESQPPSSQGKDNRQLVKRIGMITFFTLISRILGAGRDMVMSHLFGAGAMTDAFVQAFTIPNVFRRLTAEGAMTLAFIPIYAELREKQGQAQAHEFAQRTLGLVLWSTFFLTGLGVFFSQELVYLFASGFSDEPVKFNITVSLTVIMFPYLIMVSLVAWAMGILNAEKRFAVSAASPIVLNIGIIGASISMRSWFEHPIDAVAWGVILGGSAQMLMQIPSLRAVGQSLRPLNPWGDREIKRLLILLGPSLLGLAVYQINMIILRNLASFLPSGQVTYYYNANRLTELVLGVFAFAFTTASFPDLSQQTAQDNWKEAMKTLRFTFVYTQFIVMPATLGLMAAAEPIVSMLYLHGRYTWVDVQFTVDCLRAFAIGIPAIAAVRLLVAVFYALKDTKTPVLISFLTMLVTAGLGWWWSHLWQIEGLSWALSAGSWFQCACLLLFLQRQQGFSREWLDWRHILRYTVASGIMAGLVWWATSWGSWELGPQSGINWGVFLGLMVGGSLLYAVSLLILRDAQALRFARRLRRR